MVVTKAVQISTPHNTEGQVQVSELMTQLGLSDFAKIKSVLSKAGTTVKSPEDFVSAIVAKMLLNAAGGLKEAMEQKQLKSVEQQPSTEPSDNAQEGQEVKGELTLADIKTVAQAKKITQKVTTAMYEALRSEKQAMLFTLGVAEQRRDTAIINAGRSIENLRQHMEEKRQLQEQIDTMNADTLDLEVLAKSTVGLDLKKVIEGLGKEEIEREEKKVRAKEAAQLIVEGKTEEEAKEIMGERWEQPDLQTILSSELAKAFNL